MPTPPPARIRRALLAVTLALVAASCGAGDESSGAPTAASPPPTSAGPSPSPATSSVDGTPSPTPDPTGNPPSPSPDPAALRVGLEVAGSDLVAPVHAFAHDGRTLVVEQVGRVTDLDSGAVWLELTDRVLFEGERGLFGVDVHPDGGHVVAHWTAGDGATTLATYLLDDGVPDVTTETVVLRVPQPASNHNGGSALFGPDGMLWLALGDGGAAGDRFDNGQDPGTLLGALLRLDLDDPAVAVVPPDNPFAAGGARAGEGRPEVWAYGLRNPYRIAFDDTQVYVADVGQDAVEEVTALSLDQAGANLGWPQVEGDRCFRDGCDIDAFERADATYDHADTGACSVIGGLVYDGAALPALGGHFLYADLCAGILRTIRAEGGDVVDSFDLTDQVGSVAGVIGIGADTAGEPLLTFQDGRVLRLVPAA